MKEMNRDEVGDFLNVLLELTSSTNMTTFTDKSNIYQGCQRGLLSGLLLNQFRKRGKRSGKRGNFPDFSMVINPKYFYINSGLFIKWFRECFYFKETITNFG